MKRKGYIGRHVKLKRRIETQGGVIIPAGSIMKVTATWRGKFTVEAFDMTPNDMGGSSRQACKGISDWEFELLPKDPHEQARLSMVAALEIASELGLAYEVSGARLSQSNVSITKVDDERY